MHKPSLLYASPLPPQRSGIATYSRWLVNALSDYFDVTLYVNDGVTLDPDFLQFNVLRPGQTPVTSLEYDHYLYHLGNHLSNHGYIYDACLKKPGWCVLHEFVLYHLVAGFYLGREDFYRRMFQIGGANAMLALRDSERGLDPALRYDPKSVALTQELLASGNRIVVHSDYTYRLVKETAPEARVYRSELVQGDTNPSIISRGESLARWDIPPDAIVAASFGFVVPSKLNQLISAAVQRLATELNAPLYFLMVGEGDYGGSDLGDRIKLTGYVPEAEFDDYLTHADLVFNLRFPTMGETSAALLRAFAFERPCVVTDVGWFSELPDNVVLKIDCSDPCLIEEQLFEALRIFLECPRPFQKMGKDAGHYVREHHSASVVAQRYYELLTQQN